MYELKKDNVHKIVETKQQVEALLSRGYELIEKPKKEDTTNEKEDAKVEENKEETVEKKKEIVETEQQVEVLSSRGYDLIEKPKKEVKKKKAKKGED